MKIKIQNKYNNETKLFDKALYDIKENDKMIFGRFSLSAKKKDKEGKDFYISSSMAFVAFKSDLDSLSLSAIMMSLGKLIEVQGDLTVDSYNDKTFFKFIIKQARNVEEKEKKVVQSFQEKEEEIPF